MRALGVIPARHGSSRFPGKPLALLGGRPLVAHVVANARKARTLGAVVVATDDPRIAHAAQAAGAETWLSAEPYPSGTDRVAAVYRERLQAGERWDLVVNVQGDEPFLPAPAIDRAVRLLGEDPEADVATLAVPCPAPDLHRPDVVKVVLDARGRALYFSRAAIPHARDGAPREALRHLGIYVFRPERLLRMVSLPEGRLEAVEGLEQLRALEDGARIAVAVGEWPALGVDTPQDLVEAERRLGAVESS